jgi:hypothetical protein
MKYILSRKEWEEIQKLVDKINVNVDCMYVKSCHMNRTGNIKYDSFVKEVKELIEEAQESLNKLKEIIV